MERQRARAGATGRQAREHRLTLVHFSTDYVFDGTRTAHTEDEPFSPLGVYGQTKAAGDLAVATVPRHYLLRTSWVVGDGGNFVRTMRSLAERGVSPSVVDDQVGRLTFATELARATRHLLDTRAAYGTYNVTNSGPAVSWATLAREIFRHCGRDESDVSPVSTAGVRRRQGARPEAGQQPARPRQGRGQRLPARGRLRRPGEVPEERRRLSGPPT